MNFTRRVVFDTSTLVGAAVVYPSPADRALSLAFREGVICVSEAAIEHLRTILASGKWDRHMSKRSRLSFVDLLRANAWYCSGTAADDNSGWPAIRDKRTRAILSLAVAAEADVIVAIDRRLLARKSWRRIPIVSPSEFASSYDPADSSRSIRFASIPDTLRERRRRKP